MFIFVIIAALLAAYSIWITSKYLGVIRMQRAIEDQERETARLRMARQNLERVCSGQGSEIRRLKAHNARLAAEIRELEEKTSELNVTMFRESGLRILAEKEDGAKRMKMELMEKHLDDTRRKLKECVSQAEATEKMYQGIIAEKDKEIAKLQAAHARRAKTRAKAEGIPDQISLDDILNAAQQPAAAKRSSRRKSEETAENN